MTINEAAFFNGAGTLYPRNRFEMDALRMLVSRRRRCVTRSVGLSASLVMHNRARS